jgi:hypothetical protein
MVWIGRLRRSSTGSDVSIPYYVLEPPRPVFEILQKFDLKQLKKPTFCWEIPYFWGRKIIIIIKIFYKTIHVLVESFAFNLTHFLVFGQFPERFGQFFPNFNIF